MFVNAMFSLFSINKEGALLGDWRHFALALIAFFYTFLWNHSAPWPAYLSDTLAYLVGAAILAGNNVDAMGSWHIGYGFFLVPLFTLDDPFDVWAAVQVVNAIFVAVGVYASSLLLLLLEPKLSKLHHFFGLLVVVMYPPFIGNAGIWFAPALLAVTVIVLACLFVSERCFTFGQVLVLALLAGFSYWIHPIGLAVIGATGVALLSLHKRVGWRNFTVFALMAAAFAAFYKYFVHEWMYYAVTPAGYARYDHYLDGAPLQDFVSVHGLGRLLQYVLGHSAYQLVATFGLVLLGVLYALRQFGLQSELTFVLQRSYSDGKKAVSVFAISVLGLAVFLGALNFLLASVWVERTDHWIYGRYSDSVLLPLLVLGLAAFLATSRSLIASRLVVVIVFCGASVGLLAVGAVLQSNLNLSLPHSVLTSLGFWPQVVWSEKHFVVWMGFGVVGCLLLGLLWHAPKSIAVSGLLLLFFGHALFSGGKYLTERAGIERTHSQPSALVDVVRSTWPRGSCVGFLAIPTVSMESMELQRFRLYAFMFFNYQYQRLSLDQWLSGCDGPLLTYNPSEVVKYAGVRLVAREEATGLYLVARKSDTVVKRKASDPIQSLGPIVWASDLGEPCLIAGCYDWDAGQMARFSHIGVLDGSKWRTNDKAGFLFFGPYRSLDAGHYVLRLRVESTRALDAFVDVVSSQAGVTHAKYPLEQVVGANSELVIPFTLMQSVGDLQVRLYVGQQDNVAISGYSVRMAQAGGESAAVLQGEKP